MKNFTDFSMRYLEVYRHVPKINFHQFVFSYIGKGIIQASPQAVMDAVKNPRTRYTYDDSLKVNFQILSF